MSLVHVDKIPKGVYGEFSKINEEFLELLDVYKRGLDVFEICELCDLIGAIEAYSMKRWNLDLGHLKQFSDNVKESKV